MGNFIEKSQKLCAAIQVKLLSQKGQGTTEYAVLVGVLAVIAFVAIAAFKPKLEGLWHGIIEGINAL